MQDIITAQQLTETFELLEPPQKQTVYEFMTFLLSRHRVHPIQESKQLLLQTSVWSEHEIQRIYDVQEEMNTWRIPTLS